MKWLFRSSAVVLAGSMLVAQSRQVLDRIPADPARPVSLAVPVSGPRLSQTIWQIHVATGQQFGVELLPEVPLGPNEVRLAKPPQRQVNLAGLRIEEALASLVREAPDYSWTRRGQIVNITPRGRGTQSFLDQPLPGVTFQGRIALEALGFFERAFDPSAPIKTGVLTNTLSAPDEDISEKNRIRAESLGRRFSVDAQRMSARDILNAICAGHGDLSWEVTYKGNAPEYRFSRIALITPDGSRLFNR